MGQSNVDLVRYFLRASNLEQLGRTDEAIELYEATVEAGFDSSGPYDRLIAIYGHQARHREVIRISEAALRQVHTHGDKRAWYERVREEAMKAQSRLPRAAPKERA